MRPFSLANFLLLAGLFLLLGCSYGYDVEAVVHDGRLEFRLGDHRRFAGSSLHRICEFYVFDRAANMPLDYNKPFHGPIAQDPALMWGFQVPRPGAGEGCSEFPVVYGRVPVGSRELVPPKPLRKGSIYNAWVRAPGGTGSGDFRLVTAAENLE